MGNTTKSRKAAVKDLEEKTADLTSNWVKSNGGSRDLNKDNSSAFMAALGAGGAYNPAAAFGAADSYYGKASGAYDAMSNLGAGATNSLNDYQAKINNALSMTPTETYAQFAGVNPALMQQAQAATSMAMSPFGQAMEERAAQQAEAGRRAMEKRLASGGMLGTDSGAGRTALMQSIINPYAEMNAQLASKNADIFSSIYNPQSQMTMQNIYENPNRLMAALGATSGAYGNAANIFQGAGAGQAGLGNAYDQRGNSFFNALANMSQQQLIAPQFATAQTGWEKLGNAAVSLGGAALGGLL